MTFFKHDCSKDGHRYKARYDYGEPDFSMFKSIKVYNPDYIERFKPKTYVKDICVRCGSVINRNSSFELPAVGQK